MTSANKGILSRAMRKAKRMYKAQFDSKPTDKASAPKTYTAHEITFELRANGLALVDGSRATGDVEIPSSVAGHKVVTIARSAFKGNNALKSIVLPSEISTLGSSAFEGCGKLTRVELSPYLEVINARAFFGCAELSEVMLPARLKKLCTSAFEGCSKLASLPHEVLGGISSTSFLTGDTEEHLPTDLQYIGESAFRSCSSLVHVAIPYRVREIRSSTFEGCSCLQEVTLHMNMRSIGAHAFSGCSALKGIRLPESLEKIAAGAFDDSCEITAEAESKGADYAEQYGNPFALVPAHVSLGDSRMVPAVSVESEETSFFSVDQLEAAELVYQVRTPITHISRERQPAPVTPARFSLDGDIYRNAPAGDGHAGTARIVMVGDLMCRFAQQTFARHDGQYDFSKGFEHIRDAIQDSDLAIGNMETLVSESTPYMSETRYIEDRPHLNSPEAYLSAVRAAGFDVVVNAQNHVYDAGLRGIFETIDSLNRQQLMHVGVYASENDTRYLLIDVNGIKVALVAFLDQARQKMKRVNYTSAGLRSLFSVFEKEQVERDIAAARAAGAEFVIAYCHWGREYITRITNRQEQFAQTVADAGADYIFGSHSHCPQPRTVIESCDGRDVPCVYSGGNFISDISIELPYTRDTLIDTLTLARHEDGSVYIADEVFTPCRIVQEGKHGGSVAVMTCASMLESDQMKRRLEGEEAIVRIGNSLGETAKLDCVSPLVADGFVSLERSDDVILPALFAKTDSSTDVEDAARYDEVGENRYRATRDTAVNEVRITCLGRFEYDAALEAASCYDGDYSFKPSLRRTTDYTKQADFVVGALTASCSSDVPTSGMLPQGAVANCRPEYLAAIRYAGVDCLAASCFYSFDGGVESAARTYQAVRDAQMACAGVGAQRTALFEANNIRFAVLSYTQDCRNLRNLLTQRVGSQLVNVYQADVFAADVAAARAQGAEFVLVYLDLSNATTGVSLGASTRIAREMAEFGADYVIGLRPGAPSGYERFTTSRGVNVPIVTSLGAHTSGTVDAEGSLAAAIKLSVIKDEHGNIEVNDCFVPLKRFDEYDGARNVTAAAGKYYNDAYKLSDFKRVKTSLAESFGSDLDIDQTRRVKVRTHNASHLSVKDICDIAGVTNTTDLKNSLGEKFDKPVEKIVTRRQDLGKGCIAVIFKTKPERRFTAQEAFGAGALLVIGKEKAGSGPFLSVENPYQLFKKLMITIRDRYNPVVVAVTGTMGKSTTKELAYGAFAQHFNTLCVEGNNNTLNTSTVVLQKLTSGDEAYVQEVHEGSPGSAQAISEMIKPSICIITAVAEGHLEQLGTMENVVKEIMAVTTGMDENGLLILNDDNEYLHEQHPSCRTVRVSYGNAECDYYAKDVVETADQLMFTICCDEGEYRALLNMPGLHNVNNALTVFAAGREAGIPPYEIISGMAHYVPSQSEHKANRQRQNLVRHGGYQLLIDCYNSSPQALKSSIETLMRIDLPVDARRICILADMAEQGEDEVAVHFNTGEDIAQSGVDVFLCYGPLCAHLVEGVRSKGGKAYHFMHRETFNRALASIARPGDAILFKGSHSFALYDDTVVPVFGDIA